MDKGNPQETAGPSDQRVKRRSFFRKALTLLLAAAGALTGTYGYLHFSRPPPGRRRPQGQVAELPKPKTRGERSVEEALEKRRSIREYVREPLGVEEVSQLLWAAQGITEPLRGFRTAPSAGATYPLETYIVVKRNGVVGFEPGVYHYDPRGHTLTLVVDGDFSEQLMAAAVDQEWVYEAALNIVITAVFERTTQRYGDRGVHYVYMEAGHVGQNVYLQATALDLGTVVIGAFYDERVREILAAPREEKPLYIIPIGKRG